MKITPIKHFKSYHVEETEIFPQKSMIRKYLKTEEVDCLSELTGIKVLNIIFHLFPFQYYMSKEHKLYKQRIPIIIYFFKAFIYIYERISVIKYDENNSNQTLRISPRRRNGNLSSKIIGREILENGKGRMPFGADKN